MGVAMEHIKHFDLILSNPDRRREVVNEEWTIYDAYESSMTAGSPILNFYKMVNYQEIPKLVELMRNFGIGEFSLSFESTTLQRTLMGFCKADCIVTGMMEIPTPHTSNSEVSVPAVTLAIHY